MYTKKHSSDRTFDEILEGSGERSDFLFTTFWAKQVPNYIQFVEQTLQAYKITRNNMLKIHFLSTKYADIRKKSC